MKKFNQKIHQFSRVSGAVVITVSALWLSGCFHNDDDDVANGGATAVSAFNFNPDNTVTAAQLAANAMTFFPAFTEVGHEVLGMLLTSDPNNSPFDLMLCANAGSSLLSWTDTDTSGDLSAGDAVSLVFSNCDLDGIASGTISFNVVSATLDALPNTVEFIVAVNLSIVDAVDTSTFNASFAANWSTQDNNVFTVIYSADDTSGQKLAISENGVTLFQLGCFDVAQTYSPATAGTYSLAPNGVINVSNKIMSLAGGPSLNFSADALESGSKRLLSLSVPGCATVGVATGVGDSDGSYIDMEALGGGNVRLHTFDSMDVEFFTFDTTWIALTLD